MIQHGADPLLPNRCGETSVSIALIAWMQNEVISSKWKWLKSQNPSTALSLKVLEPFMNDEQKNCVAWYSVSRLVGSFSARENERDILTILQKKHPETKFGDAEESYKPSTETEYDLGEEIGKCQTVAQLLK